MTLIIDGEQAYLEPPTSKQRGVKTVSNEKGTAEVDAEDRKKIQKAIDAIGNAFFWSDTKRGNKYWSKVVRRLKRIYNESLDEEK